MSKPIKTIAGSAFVAALFLSSAVSGQATLGAQPESTGVTAPVNTGDTFVGRWYFKNKNTGREFGGAMKIVLTQPLAANKWKAIYSYDGR
jgi:hypothetical protein